MHYACVTHLLGLCYSCVTLGLRLRYACVTLALRLGYTWVTLALHLRYCGSRTHLFANSLIESSLPKGLRDRGSRRGLANESGRRS